jgi:hypothetical protein
MPVLLLPNTPAHARLANAIANWCDGEFRQNSPPGRITVTSERPILLERARLLMVDGLPTPDAEWAAIAGWLHRGRLAEHTTERIRIEDAPAG